MSDLERADSLARNRAQLPSLASIFQAIELRPQDWSCRERAASLKIALGDSNDTGNEFADADTPVFNNSHSYPGCIINRKNCLRHRINARKEQLSITLATPGRNPSELAQALIGAQGDLDSIEATGKTHF